MIDETNAANSGAAQPLSFDSSGCTKSKPKKGWPLFSIRPYMCTPQAVHACRWIAAFASTILSFWPLAVTLSLSRPMTATTENTAPSGFQHLLQPQAWLKATSPPSATVTVSFVHLQLSVPPLKPLVPALTPSSTLG